MTKQTVALLDHMGSDLSVVNAARVSFSKVSLEMTEADKKLIKYLAKHDHWTPFAHTSISLRIKAPIFVARQLGKSQVGLVWNETSRRYVKDTPEFYEPETWRAAAENVKQGSSETEVVKYVGFDRTTDSAYSQAVAIAQDTYDAMIRHGVSPEQARMVLPQAMMTEWVWTGSLLAFVRVCKLRLDKHTQKETRDVAELIYAIIKQLYPVSVDALMGDHIERS
jgi:thymidylate synthase (FAD)